MLSRENTPSDRILVKINFQSREFFFRMALNTEHHSLRCINSLLNHETVSPSSFRVFLQVLLSSPSTPSPNDPHLSRWKLLGHHSGWSGQRVTVVYCHDRMPSVVPARLTVLHDCCPLPTARQWLQWASEDWHHILREDSAPEDPCAGHRGHKMNPMWTGQNYYPLYLELSGGRSQHVTCKEAHRA